jgi:hypothetical protein
LFPEDTKEGNVMRINLVIDKEETENKKRKHKV